MLVTSGKVSGKQKGQSRRSASCAARRVTEGMISLNTQQVAFFPLVSRQENASFRKDVVEELGCHVAVGLLLVCIDQVNGAPKD